MGETQLHQVRMIELLQALTRRYTARNDVWVGGNVLLCYDPDDGRRYVCPDAMVVFGVEKRLRDNDAQPTEKVAPAVVFEITSKTTRREDMRVKKDLHLELGIPEYYMFDPTHDYLRPPLQGWHAHEGEWIRLHGEPLRSPSLGVDQRVVDGRLRLFDSVTGELQLTEREVSEAERRRADEEHKRSEVERRRAEAAEEEVARLRRLLAELENAAEREGPVSTRVTD